MGECNCMMNYPHSAVEKMFSRTSSCRSSPDPIYETEGVTALECRKQVRKMGNMVNTARAETRSIGNRVHFLENRIQEAEKTGAVSHQEKCVYSKKFSRSSEPQLPSPPNENQNTIRSLRHKLEKNNQVLVKLRNKLSMQQTVITRCQFLLSKELGIRCDSSNLEELIRSNSFDGWKSRSETIRNLKARIVDLESKLKTTQDSYRHDTDREHYDPLFQVNTDYSVSGHQRQVLNKIVAAKVDAISEKNQHIEQLNEKYREIEARYKATMSRNKVLSEELKNQKAKVKILSDKEANNKDLVDTLMKHQNLMKIMLEQQTISQIGKSQREQDIMELSNLPIMSLPESAARDTDLEKYKTLYTISEGKSNTLEGLVVELQNKLDLVQSQLAEAEKHCCEHQTRFEALAEQFDHLKRTGKIVDRRKINVGTSIQQSTMDGNLKAANEENKLLRNFIKTTVLNRSDDFVLYKSSLETAKNNYQMSLKKIRDKLRSNQGNAEKHEEEEEEEEEQEQ